MKKSVKFLGSERTVSVDSSINKASIFSSIVEIGTDNIEKGLDLYPGDISKDQFSVEKKGLEIKSGALVLKSVSQAKADKCLANMQQLAKNISCELDDEVTNDNWSTGGLAHLMPSEALKRYSWDKIYSKESKEPNKSSSDSSMPIYQIADKSSEVIPEVKTESQLMREYNNNQSTYLACLIDVLRLNTFINSLNDEKKYKITQNQATMLGF